MRLRGYILAALFALSAVVPARAVILEISTNNVYDLNPTRDWFTNVADRILITHYATDGTTARDYSAATQQLLTVTYSLGGWTQQVYTAEGTGAGGTIRWEIPQLEAATYRLVGVAQGPSLLETNYHRFLTVTSAPASDTTVNVYVTNATYITGGLISNVVTGTSNHWDATTGTLHFDTNVVTCYDLTVGTTGEAYNTLWEIDDCTWLIGTNAFVEQDPNLYDWIATNVPPSEFEPYKIPVVNGTGTLYWSNGRWQMMPITNSEVTVSVELVGKNNTSNGLLAALTIPATTSIVSIATNYLTDTVTNLTTSETVPATWLFYSAPTITNTANAYQLEPQ